MELNNTFNILIILNDAIYIQLVEAMAGLDVMPVCSRPGVYALCVV